MRDCSEVVFQFTTGHANPGISDDQCLLFLINIDCNLKRHMTVKAIGPGDTFMSELFESIRRIGYQLPYKNVPFSVE